MRIIRKIVAALLATTTAMAGTTTYSSGISAKINDGYCGVEIRLAADLDTICGDRDEIVVFELGDVITGHPTADSFLVKYIKEESDLYFSYMTTDGVDTRLLASEASSDVLPDLMNDEYTVKMSFEPLFNLNAVNVEVRSYDESLTDTHTLTYMGVGYNYSDDVYLTSISTQIDEQYIVSVTVNGKEATPIPSATPAIPEPTTATLSLLALAGLAARRRRR